MLRRLILFPAQGVGFPGASSGKERSCEDCIQDHGSRRLEQINKKEETIMRTTSIFNIALCLMLLLAVSAGAQQSLVETVANGCKTEIDAYCKDVTPGEGRVLACLYARSDKLSSKCEYALYDAAAQLERAVNALAYVVNECADDLDKFCGNVAAGEGRLLDCLKKNDAKVSSRCKEARKQVGMK
jgi:hypothetical protein